MTAQTLVRPDVTNRRLALQARILPDLSLGGCTPKDIFLELRRHLIRAFEDGWLISPIAHVHKYLRLEDGRTGFTIYGARLERANFKRRPGLPHFTRSDGAEFDFLIAGRSISRSSVEILAYDCELRFPENLPTLPRFIRYDLNSPGHANELPGLRCHVHLGHDDLQGPAPLMQPLDIIDLCLHGLSWPEKLRAS
jgi:hypothetical protein